MNRNNTETRYPTNRGSIWDSQTLRNVKRIAYMLLLCVLGSVAKAEHLQPDSIVMFSSAQIGTGIYHNTAKLADLYSKHKDLLSNKPSHDHPLGLVLSSSGSCRTLKNLIESKFDFGVVRADVAEAIFQRPKNFGFDLRVDNLRLVGKLEPVYLHIIARKKGDKPQQLADLNGSRMSLGLPDQLVSHSVRSLFEKHELPLKSVQQFLHPIDVSMNRLRNGQLDALVMFDQIPSPQIDKLLEDDKFELISLDAEKLQSTLDEYPNETFYRSESRKLEGRAQPLLMFVIDTWLVAQATASPTDIEPLADYFRDKALMASPENTPASSIAMNIPSAIPLHEAIRNSAWRTEQTSLEQTDQ